MRGGKENCGKSCVGTYCRKHNYQLKKGMKIPAHDVAVELGFCAITVFAFHAALARLNTDLFANAKRQRKILNLFCSSSSQPN